MRWETLLLVFAAAATAGCLGSPDAPVDASETEAMDALSEPTFGIEPVEVLRVEMSDGKTMENAVYRPDTDEAVPVFINFSPYWGDTAPQQGDAFAQYLIEEYVPRGYAVVLSSIRGTGHSEGCFQIAGDLELADMKETIEHFAEAEWSNGNVMAGGKSYDSTPQNGLIAKDPPKGLTGLFHVSGITDMYRYNYVQGAPYSQGPIFNTYYYLQGTDEYGASLTGFGEPEDEDEASLARLVDDVACPEFPEIQANGIGSGVHGMKTDYWIERDWNRYIEDSDWEGSIFFVHGLQDWNVKPDHILPWLDRLPEQVDVKGWLHQDTEDGTGHVYPMREDWNETMLRWLDHAGKGKDTGIEWGFEVQGDDEIWRESETWPIADEPEAITLGEPTLSTTQTQTPLVEAPLEIATEAGPLRYAGAPTVHVDVQATGNPDPVFTAVLYEEAPDGTRTWINEGVLRGLYDEGLTEPEPFPQGETVSIEIPLYPQDDVLAPGHTWVLVLGEVPQHAVVTPQTQQGITYETQDAHVGLPLAPTDTALEVQPVPTPCFAC